MASGVFICPCPQVSSPHEVAVHQIIAREVAKLLRLEFRGNCSPHDIGRDGCYYIPANTLVTRHTDSFRHLQEDSFLGGLVPEEWMGTKVISHPLWREEDFAPPGWAPLFSQLAGDSVLRGYTVFNLADALDCGLHMLQQMPVRLKVPEGKAGKGQMLVTTAQQLCMTLNTLSEDDVRRCGLVLEENLSDVVTYSVGQINVRGLIASYIGTQSLTRDNHGANVYGGSSLLMVRGTYNNLFELSLSDGMRISIEQAQRYEAAALASFKGLLISRKNYDVAHGLNAEGTSVSGVLEQSWRIGGASSAEIFGLSLLTRRSDIKCVKAESIECYGVRSSPPEGARLLFQGQDSEAGYLSKYVRLDTMSSTQD